jgi:hypothetical protein
VDPQSGKIRVFACFSAVTPKPEVRADFDLYHVMQLPETRPAHPPRPFLPIGKKSCGGPKVRKIRIFTKTAKYHRRLRSEVLLIDHLPHSVVPHLNQLLGG